MTDLLPHPWPLIIFLVALVGAGAAIVLARLLRPRPPVGWTHIGEPPPGADLALEVLLEVYPRVRGGTITWVDAPWPDPYQPGSMLGSLVTSFRRWQIKSIRDVRRLPHEVDHLDRRSATHTAASNARVAYATGLILERLARSA